MHITRAKLKQVRKDFTKRLYDIRLEEIRILSKLRNEIDQSKAKELLSSLNRLDS